MVYALSSLYHDCDFPKWMQYLGLFYGVTIISLFLNFYIQEYIKKHNEKYKKVCINQVLDFVFLRFSSWQELFMQLRALFSSVISPSGCNGLWFSMPSLFYFCFWISTSMPMWSPWRKRYTYIPLFKFEIKQSRSNACIYTYSLFQWNQTDASMLYNDENLRV